GERIGEGEQRLAAQHATARCVHDLGGCVADGSSRVLRESVRDRDRIIESMPTQDGSHDTGAGIPAFGERRSSTRGTDDRTPEPVASGTEIRRIVETRRQVENAQFRPRQPGAHGSKLCANGFGSSLDGSYADD